MDANNSYNQAQEGIQLLQTYGDSDLASKLVNALTKNESFMVIPFRSSVPGASPAPSDVATLIAAQHPALAPLIAGAKWTAFFGLTIHGFRSTLVAMEYKQFSPPNTVYLAGYSGLQNSPSPNERLFNIVKTDVASQVEFDGVLLIYK